MKRYQKGEVMLVIMVVMLAIVLLRDGHMGMMGHGGGHAEKPAEAAQLIKTDTPPAVAPKESTEP